MIFDTHAHYDDKAFDEDRDALLTSLSSAGVGTVINVCADVKSLTYTPALTEAYPFLYGAAGLHPDEVGQLTDEVLAQIRRICALPKIVAIGEIGLDYHWNTETHETQIRCFEQQLDLAREMHLPVILHSRDAAFDTLEVCKRNHLGEITGVMHCFSYSREIAAEYLNMGVYLGIGGVLTYKNGRKLREVVEYAPLESLLLETDCPYLSPEPFRGKRNSSANLPYVVQAIAGIKGRTPEEIIEITEQNAKRLFRI